MFYTVICFAIEITVNEFLADGILSKIFDNVYTQLHCIMQQYTVLKTA